MRAPRLSLGCVLGLAAALGACTSSAGYVLVTVDARPAVHDAKALSVTLANGGTMRTDSLDLKGQPFPVTFSVSAPGRTGDLAITVDALDENNLVVGHGSAATTTAASKASLQLDSTDFVVNTDYAADQFPADDFESSGFQLAAQPDGTWTAVFRDSCMQSACNVFARRFTPAGKPVMTQAAAGTNAFVVTARPSDVFTEPAVASGQAATVAMWNFTDASPATTGIACRTINAAGTLGADQTSVSNDTIAAAVTVAALSTGDFVASWNAIPAGTSSNVIREVIVKPDCSAPAAVQTVSTGTAFVDRNAVAASDTHVLFTWVAGGDLHARMASPAGVLAPADAVLIPQTTSDQVGHARIAATAGGGFALAVRWISKVGSMAPGKIELFQVSPAGALVGSPALVTDQSGSNLADDEAFGFASRPDGTVLVAWHACDSSGTMCTVSGRILKATGEPVTDAFAIPTTAGGSQRRPSVIGLPDAFAVVWSDTSGKAPDTAGQAVRARIVYPPGN
jgi:hypothetical protein